MPCWPLSVVLRKRNILFRKSKWNFKERMFGQQFYKILILGLEDMDNMNLYEDFLKKSL